MSILLSSGIPITEALTLTSTIFSNEHFLKNLQNLNHEISIGKQLHTAMQQNKFFPEALVQIVQVGEESGSLEKMLTKIADLYEADLERMISVSSKLLEPLIMIILGVLIGGLVIALYLPMFKLGTVI